MRAIEASGTGLFGPTLSSGVEPKIAVDSWYAAMYVYCT